MPSTYLTTTMPRRAGVIDDMDVEAAPWLPDEVIEAIARAAMVEAARYGISPGALGITIMPDHPPAAFVRARVDTELALERIRKDVPVVREVIQPAAPTEDGWYWGEDVNGEWRPRYYPEETPQRWGAPIPWCDHDGAVVP